MKVKLRVCLSGGGCVELPRDHMRLAFCHGCEEGRVKDVKMREVSRRGKLKAKSELQEIAVSNSDSEVKESCAGGTLR